jgi:glutathione S-transferase
MPDAPDLELVSFKLCPYVQRVVITLVYRRMPFRMTFIDLAAPPAWFVEASPFGKVPILKVGETVLFESAVINEYINDVAPGPSMLPAEPLPRAVQRAWIELASACLGDHSDLVAAQEEKPFKRALAGLRDKLERVEGVLGSGPYWAGPTLSLVDTAFAPLFMRLELLRPAVAGYDPAELPGVARWSQTLLALAPVRESVVPEFRDLYLEDVRGRGGHLAGLLPT